MYLDPIHPLFLRIYTPPLHHPPQQSKIQEEKNGENKIRKIEKGKELCHGSWSVTQQVTPYTHLSIHLYQKVFIAKSLWPNWRPLDSATH